MESSITKHQKNIASLIHISTFAKYLFPFGNFILPLVLWTSNKNDSAFVDHNGKQALNFQISILIYSLVLGFIAFIIALFQAWDLLDFINSLEHNKHAVDFRIDHIFKFGSSLMLLGVIGLIWFILFIMDIVCSILGAVKSNEGKEYYYPITIKFIR